MTRFPALNVPIVFGFKIIRVQLAHRSVKCVSFLLSAIHVDKATSCSVLKAKMKFQVDASLVLLTISVKRVQNRLPCVLCAKRGTFFSHLNAYLRWALASKSLLI